MMDDAAEIRRLRDAIVSARWRLAKGRALWNGPCHECDAALERGLTGADIRERASKLELVALDAPPEADVKAAALDIFQGEITGWINRAERALTEYGNERARAARAAAIEETAQAIDGWSGDYSYEIECFSKWAKKTIRALADTPPLGGAEHARSDGQSEEGEG